MRGGCRMESRQDEAKAKTNLIEAVLENWSSVKLLVSHAMDNTKVFQRWMNAAKRQHRPDLAVARLEDKITISQFSHGLISKLFAGAYEPGVDLDLALAEKWEKIKSCWWVIEKEMACLSVFSQQHKLSRVEIDPFVNFYIEFIDVLLGHLDRARSSIFSATARLSPAVSDIQHALSVFSDVGHSCDIARVEMTENMEEYLDAQQSDAIKQIEIKCQQIKALLDECLTLLKIRTWIKAIDQYHHHQDSSFLRSFLQGLDVVTLAYLCEKLNALLPAQQQFNAYLSIPAKKIGMAQVGSTLFSHTRMDEYYAVAKAKYEQAASDKDKLLAALDTFLVGAKCWHGPSLFMAGQIIATNTELNSPHAFIFLVLAYASSRSVGQQQMIRGMILATLARDLLRVDKSVKHGINESSDPVERLRIDVTRIAYFLSGHFADFLHSLRSAVLLDLGELYIQIHLSLRVNPDCAELLEEQGYLDTAVMLFGCAYDVESTDMAKSIVKEKVLAIIKASGSYAMWRSESGEECLDVLAENLNFSAEEMTGLMAFLRKNDANKATSSFSF